MKDVQKTLSGWVLIVDPFSSGSHLANRIKQLYDLDCAALITTTELPAPLLSSFRSQDFTKIFNLKGSLDDTVEDIESYFGGPPDFIFCGSEPGVLVFDVLSSLWNLLPNDLSKSHARRDKYLMQKQLKNDGISYIPFFKSGEVSKIISWAKAQNFNHFVIKPLRSFGTDGVSLCHSELDLKSACEKIMGMKDCSGETNHEILVQKLISGDEYVVDAVSSYGKHYIVNMFKYSKVEIGNVPVYKSMTSVDINEHKELSEYINQVLTSLGFRHGPSHNEVFITDEGPVLVESGARMHGGLGPKLVEECNSHSLIDLSIQSRIDTVKYQKTTSINPSLKRYAIEYFLITKRSGIISDIKIDEMCSGLESYFSSTCSVSKGDFIHKTVNLATSVARVVLVSQSLKKLNEDLLELCCMDDNEELISISQRDVYDKLSNSV